MATISLQVAPAKYYSNDYFTSKTESPDYHDGNAHFVFQALYLSAKQQMEKQFAEPPQKKRRLNDDMQIAEEEDYIVLAKSTLELV